MLHIAFSFFSIIISVVIIGYIFIIYKNLRSYRKLFIISILVIIISEFLMPYAFSYTTNLFNISPSSFMMLTSAIAGAGYILFLECIRRNLSSWKRQKMTRE